MLDLELIVRRARDDLAAKLGDGPVTQDGSQSAGREDVAVDLEDLVYADDLDVHLGADTLYRSLVDVGTEELGTLLFELLGQVIADAAEALDRHRATLEARVVEVPLGRGLHPLEDTPGSDDRRVAAAAVGRRNSCDPAGLRVDQLHVLHVRADVFGGDVEAAERIDETAERPE